MKKKHEHLKQTRTHFLLSANFLQFPNRKFVSDLKRRLKNVDTISVNNSTYNGKVSSEKFPT